MNKRKILVLFDIGAVLLKLSFRRFYEEGAKLSKNLTSEWFKKKYTLSNLSSLSVTGKIKAKEYFTRLRDLINPEMEISDEELKKLASLMLGVPVKEVVDLKKKIYEAGYSVGIFSNISDYDLEFLEKNYPEIFEVFDGSSPSIFSFEVGSMKPDSPMYQKIKTYKKIILIDDKESYLKTGIEGFGWFGILFTLFIDKDEALRAVHNDATKPSKNFLVANSVEELISALRKFGVEV